MDGWGHRIADLVPVVVTAVVGGLVVVAAWGSPGATLVPLAAWAAILVVLLATLAATTILVERMPERLVLPAFAVACAAAIALVVLAPGAPWIMIVLVFTALVSGYLGSLWLSAAVVAANTAAIVAGTLLLGERPSGVALAAAIYLVLQAQAVLFVRIFMRELDLRRELEVTTVRLRAAQGLLAESSRGEERIRIARDLHDVLGHQLTVLALDLEAASHTDDDAARASIVRARDVARGMLGDVRQTVSALRAPAADVEAALRALAADVSSIDVVVTVEADGDAMRAEQAEAVVRAAQELLTNALRHAQATSIAIAVRHDGDRRVLAARDDGVGAAAVLPGNGLTGVRERVEALGGTVVVDGSDGFRVRAAMPS